MSSNLVSEPVASAMSVCTLCDLAKRTRRFSVVLVLALRLDFCTLLRAGGVTVADGAVG
jgi:hypothetical protein